VNIVKWVGPVGFEPTITRGKSSGCCSFTPETLRTPGRNRTCYTRGRNPLLCPLSYKGLAAVEGFEPSVTGIKDQGFAVNRHCTSAADRIRTCMGTL
jgi:hypothetical protein